MYYFIYCSIALSHLLKPFQKYLFYEINICLHLLFGLARVYCVLLYYLLINPKIRTSLLEVSLHAPSFHGAHFTLRFPG